MHKQNKYIAALNSLVEKYRDQILKAENLIIDIRGNEGGGTNTTRVLMPFLVTASKMLAIVCLPAAHAQPAGRYRVML